MKVAGLSILGGGCVCELSKSPFSQGNLSIVLPLIVEQAQPRALSVVLNQRQHSACNRSEKNVIFLYCVRGKRWMNSQQSAPM